MTDEHEREYDASEEATLARYVAVGRCAMALVNADEVGELADAETPSVALCAVLVAGRIAEKVLKKSGAHDDGVGARLDWVAEQMFQQLCAKAQIEVALTPIVSKEGEPRE